MQYTPSMLDVAAVGVALYVLKRLFTFVAKSRRSSLPPGPPGLPIIGNVFDIPHVAPYKIYTEWGMEYGPIMHISAFGQPLIIVNDVSIATELLDKRSTIYSGRPSSTMAGDLGGWNDSLPILPYGDRWRAHRRHFHSVIGSTRMVLTRYDSLLEHEARRLAQRLIHTPNELQKNICRAAAGIIMKIAYGYDTKPQDDPLVTLVDEGMAQFSELTESSAVWLVDYFPILKYVPAWVPGAGFRKIAARSRHLSRSMAEVPFKMVKDLMEKNIASPCMITDQLEKASGSPEDEHALMWAALSVYGGGFDTTMSSMLNLFMCMTLFPEAQKKAQEEIAAVIGRDRLPTLEDRPNLPYVNAVISEVLRWSPVAPMALPHELAQDDVYENYHLPAGALIFPNVYAMLHDPSVYPDPNAFTPERFIATEGKPAAPDPRISFFGFGRRVCPGRHLADTALWIMMTVCLSSLSISKSRDATGKEITPNLKYTDGSITHPEGLECDIKPNSAHVEALIEQELTQYRRDRN